MEHASTILKSIKKNNQEKKKQQRKTFFGFCVIVILFVSPLLHIYKNDMNVLEIKLVSKADE